MRQIILNNGNVIFNSILEELSKAEKEILVAQTWFTDNELLDKLIDKAKEGIEVKVIISDKEDNKRLNFNSLSNLPSASIKKRKNKSYGGINTKYCIIDEKIAISGSYNWSKNAKTNSEENVIITEHPPTVQGLQKQFYKVFNGKISLIQKLFKLLKKGQRNDGITIQNASSIDNQETEMNLLEEIVLKVDNVLDSIVTTEIENFDREELENAGYHRASMVGGDPFVLSNIMNSLYHLFISDRNNIQEKKLNLKTKIDAFVEEQIHNFKELFQGRINEKEKEKIAKEKQSNSDIIRIDSDIKQCNLDIDDLENRSIPNKLKEIVELEEVKLEMDRKFIPAPEKKWYHYVPYVIIPIGLLIAIFLFYSSSAYILLYAKEDYELQDRVSNIFNAKAFWEAIGKGGTALIYVIFFTTIPFALSLITNYVKHKTLKWFCWFAIIALDTLIAFRIKEIIGEINFLETGVVNVINQKWILEFIIIFFLGFIPLMTFIIALERFRKFISDQILTKEQKEAQIKKEQLTNQILLLDGELFDLEEEKNDLSNKINQKEEEKNQINNNLLFLPVEYQKEINIINEEKKEKIIYIKNRADIYKNGIDNNSIYIPLPALKDRVNVFLQGWDKWLHDEMSGKRAKEFSSTAKEITDNWITNNMQQLRQNETKIITLK